MVASLLAFASEDSVLEPLSVAELLPVWEPLPAAELLWEDEVLSLEETLLLVLWEELDSPLELDVLAEGAVLSLLEVLCEGLSEVDVDPEEAPDEAAEELPELLVLPLEELDVLPEPDDAPEELVEPALTPLTVTFRVLLVTVQPL